MGATRREWMIGGMATGAAALALGGCGGPSTGAESAATGVSGSPEARAAAETAAVRGPDGKLPLMPGDMTLGSPAAKVQMIEFASPTCGHCATFHTEVLPTIKAQYVDTGKVQFILREFVIAGPPDVALVQLARCGGADAGRYFSRLDAIYRSQNEYRTAVQNGQGPAAVARLGGLMGLSTPQVQACAADPAGILRAESVYLLAGKLNVRGTPSVFLNGDMFNPGAEGYTAANLGAAIDRLLAG